jgi:hypothetical protein
MSDSASIDDEVLHAIDDGDTHDQLLGYMNDGESAEDALKRILSAYPSFVDRECNQCGRDLAPLADHDWVASRLKVEATDRRRTDLYCGFACLAESMNAEFRFGGAIEQ